MPLNYFLIDNHLTPDPNDQMAVTTGVKSYTDTEIAERMTHRGSTVTKADILAVLEDYITEIGFIVAEGSGINNDLLQATPSISGKFNDLQDGFDVSRHKLNYNLRFGRVVRESIKHVKVAKVSTPETGPVISVVKDTVSALTDGTMTAGGTLEILGNRLRILTEIAENGIFFIATDGTEYKTVTIVENKPSRLILLIPSLPLGEYALEVRTNFINSTAPGKQIRVTRFGKTLSM